MSFWHRLAIAGAIFAVVTLLARIIDWWLARRPLPREAATRYRVLRRSVTAAILVVGLCSSLLVIPQVRAVAGGLLASSAVLAVIIGFASQRTLGNFVAGLLIAISQPVRLGANEKLVSDTIRNSSIRSRGTFAEITVQVPLTVDLRTAIDGLQEEVAGEREASVFVSALDANAIVTIRAAAVDEDTAQRLESELRVRAAGRLRALGAWG